jgi:hypothetical protein
MSNITASLPVAPETKWWFASLQAEMLILTPPTSSSRVGYPLSDGTTEVLEREAIDKSIILRFGG